MCPASAKGCFKSITCFKNFSIGCNGTFIKNYTRRVLHGDKIEIDASCLNVLKSFQVSGGCYIVGTEGMRIGKDHMDSQCKYHLGQE